jgi:DNA-directed RNA polymerase specialized sigma24 family protein
MDGQQSWRADDPEIAAIRRDVEEELERARRESIEPDKPDPVLADLWSGASLRELAAARDDLARAHARYAHAVRGARAAGLSWGETGRVLGVPKQLLHRRFSRPAQTAAP